MQIHFSPGWHFVTQLQGGSGQPGPGPVLSLLQVVPLLRYFVRTMQQQGEMMGGGAQSCWRDDKWDWAAEYADQSCAITGSS